MKQNQNQVMDGETYSYGMQFLWAQIAKSGSLISVFLLQTKEKEWKKEKFSAWEIQE